MPLRASSHPGSPNSPSCSALAWYSCWPGLSPWGESWKRTRVARTAALTRYRYATQPTNVYVTTILMLVVPIYISQSVMQGCSCLWYWHTYTFHRSWVVSLSAVANTTGLFRWLLESGIDSCTYTGQVVLPPWWCHCMELLAALLALYEGNPSVIYGFPSSKGSNVGLWHFLCC